MSKKKTAQSGQTLYIETVQRDRAEFIIVGTSPLIMNSMSAKAQRDLLAPRPSGEMTKSEKQASLKHNPLAEFRAACYYAPEKNWPTALTMPAAALKRAIATAALETKGAKKTQIGRLTYVEGEYLPVYGVPELFLSVVRSADMARTPDVRSRAILREWVMVVPINFVAPTLTATTVATLLANAGMVVGIGDFRQEKGAGSYGCFALADKTDANVRRIIAAGGRAAQLAALEDPEPYDANTRELLSWFDGEMVRRGRKVA